MEKVNHHSAKVDVNSDQLRLPVQVELYINRDGTVTFADLAADILPIAATLNPNQPLACDVRESHEETSAQ